MKVGDLVFVTFVDNHRFRGMGIYLGHANRGDRTNLKVYESLLWKGRIATFDKTYWRFEVVNEAW